jgi:hypothetical protein
VQAPDVYPWNADRESAVYKSGPLFFIQMRVWSYINKVSGVPPKPLARRLESWEARKSEAMTFLSLQASKLSSLPATLLTPET